MDDLRGDGTACLDRRVRYRRGCRLLLARIARLPVDARATVAEEVCEERRGGRRTLPRWRRRYRLVAVRRRRRNACRGCDTACQGRRTRDAAGCDSGRGVSGRRGGGGVVAGSRRQTQARRAVAAVTAAAVVI